MQETTVAVCEKTKPNSLHPWRCQRAAEHDDDCHWPIESEHYNLPLDGYSAPWLASEVRALLVQIEQLKRDHRDSAARVEQQNALLMRGLIALAPANSKRKNVPTADVQKLWQAARG